MSVSLSLRKQQLGSHRTDFHEICYKGLFENLSKKFKYHQNRTRIQGTLHEDQ